jgi:hypothetical protein
MLAQGRELTMNIPVHHKTSVQRAAAFIHERSKVLGAVYLDYVDRGGNGIASEQYDSPTEAEATLGGAVPPVKRIIAQQKKLLREANRMKKSQGTIAFDLDGTLAQYDGDASRIGPPILGMREVVQALVEQHGQPVAVLTARDDLQAVHTWLQTNGFPDLPVTNRKDPRFVTIVDDRALNFTSAMVSTPEKQKRFLGLVLRFLPYWEQVGKSLYVRPKLSARDVGDGRNSHVEPGGDFTKDQPRLSEGADFQDLRLGELGATAHLPTMGFVPPAPFGQHIGDVVTLRPGEQVLGIDASGGVARVEDLASPHRADKGLRGGANRVGTDLVGTDLVDELGDGQQVAEHRSGEAGVFDVVDLLVLGVLLDHGDVGVGVGIARHEVAVSVTTEVPVVGDDAGYAFVPCRVLHLQLLQEQADRHEIAVLEPDKRPVSAVRTVVKRC